jgi:phthiocerol/phenolphthiocerol synthesis type-I polyketide synthase E
MNAEADRLNDIAVVGMDVRLPGANDLDQFWRNLRDGRESVVFLSSDPPVVRKGAAHVKATLPLEGMDLFDASFFGFNPREAETMDPQIRLFLEGAWHAL